MPHPAAEAVAWASAAEAVVRTDAAAAVPASEAGAIVPAGIVGADAFASEPAAVVSASETAASPPAFEAFARAAGAEALPGFFAGLLLTLATVLLARAVFRRIGLPREHNRLTPGTFFLLHLGLGFAGVVVAGAVFAAIAEAIGASGPLGRLDQVYSDAVIRSTPAAALAVFAVVTHLGDQTTQIGVCIAVGLLLIGARRRALGVAWVGAVAGNGILNTTLKNVFERARPLHRGGWVEAGYSFPSGHSSGSVVVYGMLAYLAFRLLPPRWHLPAALAAAATAYTTGSSRVFLQVHFASDVVAGFVSGATWLAVCILSAELLRRRRQSGRPGAASSSARR